MKKEEIICQICGEVICEDYYSTDEPPQNLWCVQLRDENRYAYICQECLVDIGKHIWGLILESIPQKE